MEILNISTTIKKDKVKSIAIGCFDGFHLGHKELFKELDKKDSLILIIDKAYNYSLIPNEYKQNFIDISLCFVDFDSIKDMSAINFLSMLKKELVNLEKIVVGYDFRFGLNRSHTAFDIEALSGIKTVIVDEFKLDNISVHSKAIREFIKNGKMSEANKFLGRIYSIQAEIVKGQGLGSKELFATINIDSKDKYLLPKDGVYASFIKLNDKKYNSVSFIGKRQSTDNNFSIETHILDEFKEEVCKEATVFFLAYIRENQKFDNLKDLKERIRLDCDTALKLLKDFNER